jgi:hypothetical protein
MGRAIKRDEVPAACIEVSPCPSAPKRPENRLRRIHSRVTIYFGLCPKGEPGWVVLSLLHPKLLKAVVVKGDARSHHQISHAGAANPAYGSVSAVSVVVVAI